MEESTIYLVLDFEIFCYFWRNKRPFWGCLKETSHSIVLEKQKSGTLEGYTFIDTKATFLTELEGFEGAYKEKYKKTMPTTRTVFLMKYFSILKPLCIN